MENPSFQPDHKEDPSISGSPAHLKVVRKHRDSLPRLQRHSARLLKLFLKTVRNTPNDQIQTSQLLRRINRRDNQIFSDLRWAESETATWGKSLEEENPLDLEPAPAG